MKTFLTAWLAEAPRVLARELAEAIRLQPSHQLPVPESSITLSIEPGGSLAGRFLVTVERERLHTLLTSAGAAGSSTEADRELWETVVRAIAIAAAEAATPGSPGSALMGPASIVVKDGACEPGLPMAAWELCLGDTAVPLAFIDEIETVAVANGSAAQPAKSPAASTSTDGVSKIAPGGVELLLGVELEASLRFGSCEMPLNEVLRLGAGDVVELDRNVTDPVDLLVGDKIVARGEVVLIDGSFGLRVMEVTEPKKCLENIRCLF